jgi:hypothetical protein
MLNMNREGKRQNLNSDCKGKDGNEIHSQVTSFLAFYILEMLYR